MSFIDRLLAFFNKDKRKNQDPFISHSCPVCWGYQEYDAKTVHMGKEKQIDVKNHTDKYMKVEKFMVEHVDGFKNKNKIVKRCPSCGGKRIIYKEKP